MIVQIIAVFVISILFSIIFIFVPASRNAALALAGLSLLNFSTGVSAGKAVGGIIALVLQIFILVLMTLLAVVFTPNLMQWN